MLSLDFKGESVLSVVVSLLGEFLGELERRLGELLGEFDKEDPKAPRLGGFFRGGRPFNPPAFLADPPPRGGNGPFKKIVQNISFTIVIIETLPI